MTHRLSSDLTGRTLNERYLVLKQIGVGGFAAVYRARDTRLGNDVAIKVLHPEHTRNIADLERFRNEARLAGVINDPHFVKVTDFFQEREHFCFVMEHLEGVTLREELKRLPGKIMSWPRALKLARQLCGGLSVAHTRGLIHRDIKPENIFLERGTGERVKLLDLGVAKVLEDHNWSGLCKNLSNTGDIIGSPCYIAPEQVRGERGLDVRVDIYALGIVLYEMVAGRVPFRGQTAFETLEHHVRSEPKRPTIVSPELNLPRAVEDLIMRALKKRPQDRYRSAQEMDAAIRNELDNRSDQRRVRSVQYIQVSSDLAWGGAAPAATQTTAVLETEEPTTAKQMKAAAESTAPPAERALHPGPGAAWPTRPADTDVTPPPPRGRTMTPKAQGVPTSPDIQLEAPMAPPEPRAVPSVRPLQVRTMVMLGSFAAASLIATCSVGTVLAMAIAPSGARPVEKVPEVWAEPPEPQAPLPVEVVEPTLKNEEQDEDVVDEVEPAVKVDDETTIPAESKPKSEEAPKLSVAPKPPRVVKPRPVTMGSIAKRAAARIKKECVINKFAGVAEGRVSIQFSVNPTTGKVIQLRHVEPVPTLADQACVIRIASTLVTDFTGAVDLQPIFVYSFPVVR